MGAKKKRTRAHDEGEIFRVRTEPKIPFAFVLDELEAATPHTAQMFGCTAANRGSSTGMTSAVLGFGHSISMNRIPPGVS